MFCDKLTEVLDPEDEAIQIILKEAIAVVPQLLVHPNQRVRELVEKFYKNNKGETK